MSNNETLSLYDAADHKNVLLEDFTKGGLAVQANQHLVVHGKAGMLLDPGGHKVYSRVLSATMQQLRGAKLQYLFLSHQDPDIVAATNGWLMTTDAVAYCSQLWTRFVPHFGLDRLVETRLLPIPDHGMTIDLDGCPLQIVPAHYLHSPGNFHVYDPVSKILYSGDLGASIGAPGWEVTDFEEHRAYMDGFHRRYMAGNAAMRAWVRAVSQLDIETIAPQHGCIFKGKALVEQFLRWAESFQCGLDFVDEFYGSR
jgi:flavorubredoxin